MRVESRTWSVAIVCTISLMCVTGDLGASDSSRATPLDRAEPGLRHIVRDASWGSMVLLAPKTLVVLDEDWREGHDEYILDFGVRSERRAIDATDLANLKELLFSRSSYFAEGRVQMFCSPRGDAAIALGSGEEEVWIMVDLESLCLHIIEPGGHVPIFQASVEPIADELARMVAKYFGEDARVADLVSRW